MLPRRKMRKNIIIRNRNPQQTTRCQRRATIRLERASRTILKEMWKQIHRTFSAMFSASLFVFLIHVSFCSRYRWDENLQRSVVKAATLDKLIQRFTSSKYEGRRENKSLSSSSFVMLTQPLSEGRNPINAFLLSYRLFISPVELLSKLIHRYASKDPKDTDDHGVVQLRVLAFMKVRYRWEVNGLFVSI